MNMIKVLWRRFQKWLGTFTMLLFEVSPPTKLFRHFYHCVFGVRSFGNTKSMRVIFFSKYSKFSPDFKNENAGKDWGKRFCLWDNFTWIGIGKLSLLRTAYFSFPANVLRNSSEILHVNKRDFFQLNRLIRDQWIWSGWFDADLNSAWTGLPCCLSKGSLKPDFLDIYLTTFSKSVISEIQKLWRSSLFQNF